MGEVGKITVALYNLETSPTFEKTTPWGCAPLHTLETTEPTPQRPQSPHPRKSTYRNKPQKRKWGPLTLVGEVGKITVALYNLESSPTFQKSPLGPSYANRWPYWVIHKVVLILICSPRVCDPPTQ